MVLHGARVDDDVLVGMGAVVMNGAHLGVRLDRRGRRRGHRGHRVPPGSLVAGVPARVVKDLGDAAVQRIRANAISYTDRLDQHRALREVR